MELTIAPMTPGMAAPCAVMAATAPDPWRLEDLEKAAADENRRCFVALQNGAPVGFACFLALCGSADLQLVAVAPSQRRQGVAKALLRHALASLQAEGMAQVLLEARASNAGAIGLYRGLGFVHMANRPGMYAHPPEDGVLMGLSLAANTETKEANS